MSKITPTVGRIVWYRLALSQDEHGIDAKMARFNTQGEPRPDPLPAIIVGINTPEHVNLIVFDAAGVAHPRTSVLLAQEGYAVPGNDGYAEWMPYQLGQAAKVGANETASRSAAGLVSMSRPLCHSDGSLDFADALMLLKEGKGMARAGWNGKGLWIELESPSVAAAITVPFVVICYPADALTTPGARVPWAPSQTDMLAEDWVVVQ